MFSSVRPPVSATAAEVRRATAAVSRLRVAVGVRGKQKYNDFVGPRGFYFFTGLQTIGRGTINQYLTRSESKRKIIKNTLGRN